MRPLILILLIVLLVVYSVAIGLFVYAIVGGPPEVIEAGAMGCALGLVLLHVAAHINQGDQ